MSTTRQSKWAHLFPEADRLLTQGVPMSDVCAALTQRPADQKSLRTVLYQRRHRAGLSGRSKVSRTHLYPIIKLLLGQDLRTSAILSYLVHGAKLAPVGDWAGLRLCIHRLKPAGWRGLVREVKPEHLEGFTH